MFGTAETLRTQCIQMLSGPLPDSDTDASMAWCVPAFRSVISVLEVYRTLSIVASRQFTWCTKEAAPCDGMPLATASLYMYKRMLSSTQAEHLLMAGVTPCLYQCSTLLNQTRNT